MPAVSMKKSETVTAVGEALNEFQSNVYGDPGEADYKTNLVDRVGDIAVDSSSQVKGDDFLENTGNSES